MNSDLPQRKKIRLSYWDYSRPGYYFLTVCSYQRRCVFGSISQGTMRSNELGNIIEEELLKSFELRPELRLDAYVLMPNHVHMIVCLDKRDSGSLNYSREPRQREVRSISSFVGGYKSKATARINTLRQSPGVPVWHYRFNDHIIRTEESLLAVRQYIADNPRSWDLDKHHPRAQPGHVESIDQVLALESSVLPD